MQHRFTLPVGTSTGYIIKHLAHRCAISVHHRPRVKVLFILLDGGVGKQDFTLFLEDQLTGIQWQRSSSPDSVVGAISHVDGNP